MKLRYKGVCKDMTKLPSSELPENAVKFIEPDSKEAFEKAMIPFMIPPLLLVGAALPIRFLLHGNIGLSIGVSFWWVLPIIVVSVFAGMVVHELLHAICFGKNSEVDIYISSAFWFVHSVTPISKKRFIFICLLPNIVLGIIPLLIWLFIPMSSVMGIIFIFALVMTGSGCGDYMNAYNAFRQMPKGSIQQGSGMNSYWFMPDSNDITS